MKSLQSKSLAELKRIAERELGITPEDLDAAGNSPHRKNSWIQAIVRGRADKRFRECPNVKPLPNIKLIQIYPRPPKDGN